MKLLLLGISCLLVLGIKAQQGEMLSAKNEIRVGWGLATAPDIATAIGKGIFGNLIGFEKSDIKSSGVFVVSYLRKLHSKYAVGLDLAIQQTETRYSGFGQNNLLSTDTWFTAMVRGDYRYINKPGLQLYGSLAAGITYLTADFDNENLGSVYTPAFAFQVSPIGIRYGKKFAFFAEAGFGFRGVFHGGLSVNF